MSNNLKLIAALTIVTFISLETQAKNFCDFNGKSQKVGATLGPYICGENGTWLNQKDVCMYNGKPYTAGAIIAMYACRSGPINGKWVNENAIPVEVPVGVNTSHNLKEKSVIHDEDIKIAPSTVVAPK